MDKVLNIFQFTFVLDEQLDTFVLSTHARALYQLPVAASCPAAVVGYQRPCALQNEISRAPTDWSKITTSPAPGVVGGDLWLGVGTLSPVAAPGRGVSEATRGANYGK